MECYRSLWLVRHAQAEPASVTEDVERALTVRGERQVLRMQEHLNPQISPRAIIYASYAQRCQQSAQAFISDQYPQRQYQVSTAMCQLPHYFRVMEAGILEDTDEVVLIGHLPALKQTLATLLGLAYRGFWPCASAIKLELTLEPSGHLELSMAQFWMPSLQGLQSVVMEFSLTFSALLERLIALPPLYHQERQRWLEHWVEQAGLPARNPKKKGA